MRWLLAAGLLLVATSGTLAADGIRPPWESSACAEKWPDPEIPIPDLVHAFILAECGDHAGTGGEDVDDCITGEGHGYRATVMMLTDRATREMATERYRVCRAGLGMQGGRFHRRRAECIGAFFRYVWRFESSRRASIREADWLFRTAAADAMP